MIRTQPLAAVAMVAVLALQPPSSSEPPPPSSSTPAPTSSSEPPPVSSSSATPPPVSSSEPTVPSSTEPPPTSAPTPTPPPAPAPVAGGGREWTLKASRLELGGLNYVGVVDALLNGQVVKVLKFTTSDMKIKDLVQTSEVSPGVKLVTAARPGSTSTVNLKKLDGQEKPPPLIELFTVQLKGNLDILGIKIPVDYSAAHPPPLNVPFATFTDVTVRNTDLKGGNLTIPGARIYVVTDQAPVERR